MEIKKKLDFLKSRKTQILTKILQVLCCFLIMYAINSVKIFGSHNPFGIAFLFALIWAQYNYMVVGVIFVITFYLHSFLQTDLQIALMVFVFVALLFVINKFKKFKFKHITLYILSLLAYIPYIVLKTGDNKQNLTMLISIIFAMFFLYICKYFFKGTIKRGYCFRLNPDEKICGAIIIAIIGFGFSNLNYFNIEFATVICGVLTLVTTYTYGTLESLVIAFVYGLGVSLNFFNPIYMSYYLCFGLFASAFKTKNKVFSSISIIIVHVFFSSYFSSYLIFSPATTIAMVVMSVLFLIFPNKILLQLKDVFAGCKNKVAVRNVVKSSKDKITKKLLEAGKVFKEMEFSFKRTLQKTLPITEKKELMKQDIASNVCKNCPNFSKCLRINGEYTTQVFDSLIEAGVNKGKVGAIDLNNYLVSRCTKMNYLLQKTNDIIKSYREYNILSKNMDCSRVLVAEQFCGVSSVINNIAKDVSEEISFDVDLETRISEDLLYKNIFCEEVVVYEKNLLEKSIVLLIKNDNINKKLIEKVVSKACKNSLKIVNIEPSELPNISIVSLASIPNFDIVFGSASCNKTGTLVSGDTHSFIKIDNGKYMLALSDGMGSGNKARETSDLAISLIENYYKAGFENDLILSSVNKLLSLNNEESFSAIDICIFDFFKNTMDFIKLGTPNSFIKKKTGVELVKSSGLPIGILEDIKPHITKKYIANFDIVILVSDGITDAFRDNSLGVFINNLNLINPQEIADAILLKARSIVHNVTEDDMTVIVARIFPTK